MRPLHLAWLAVLAGRGVGALEIGSVLVQLAAVASCIGTRELEDDVSRVAAPIVVAPVV